MSTKLLIHASQLVTCSGYQGKKGEDMKDIHVIEDGAVLFADGEILEVGNTEDLIARHGDAEQIDCSGHAVLPGFVDSHTHFLFGGYRAEEFSWRLEGVSYMDIMNRGGGINATLVPTRKASGTELFKLGMERLKSALSFGITTMEGKSGYGMDMETELRMLRTMKALDQAQPVDVVSTYMGAHSTPPEYKGRTEEYVDFIIEQVLPSVEKEGTAEFCDVFCERNVFEKEQTRRILTAAGKRGLKPKLHADEIVPLGGAELAAELGAVSADHLLRISEEGIRQLARSKTVATLLPATAFSLKEEYAPGRKLINEGCCVALASDFNPGSCFSNSIPLLFALSTIYMNMTIEEAISALTINGAAALDRAETTGSIDPGKKADFVILEYPDYHFLNYYFAVNIVKEVYKDGKIVYKRQQ